MRFYMDNLQHIAPQNYHKYDLNHMTQFSLEMTLVKVNFFRKSYLNAKIPYILFARIFELKILQYGMGDLDV